MNTKIHKIILIITILFIPLIIWGSNIVKDNMDIRPYYEQLYEEAEVLQVIEEELKPDPVVDNMRIGRQVVIVEVLTGKYKGEIQEVINVIDQGHNVVTYEGQNLIVGIRETESGPNIWIYNHKRSTTLYILVAMFLILLIYFGGKKGLDAIVALLFTATLLIFVMVPMIFKGVDPILTTVITVFIATIVSFILIGGIEKKTLIAIMGTLMGTLTAGIIAFSFGKMTHLTGVNLDKGNQLVYLALDYGVKVKGLMFASILIASLGAVMDVSMSIASSMNEIHKLNKHMTFKDLFGSGMNIGKDIMGTMANTLILAFMGGSLSLMLILWGYNMSFTQLINMPFLSLELIQGFAGSIGIVLTVPFTALVATLIYRKKR